MSGVRRRGYLTAAVAMLGAALVTALLAAPPDRPVDIRLVAPPPPAAETVTASATTTVSAVGPVVLDTPSSPPPPPPPPPPAATSLPRPGPTSTSTTAPPPSRPRSVFDLLRCDAKYFDKLVEKGFERCLPWPLAPNELCKFLEDNNLRPTEIRGPDGRKRNDVNCD